jgi:phosphoglycerate kinase
MNTKTLADLNLQGRRALIRVDFNVPLVDGIVGDDTRIRAALPTITYCLEQGASVVLMSHLGRPKGKGREEAFSLRPVASHLSSLLGKPVQFLDDCVGPEVEAAVASLSPGEIALLENVRFYAEEEGKAKKTEGASADEIAVAKQAMKDAQKNFARQLSALGDLYINDAFGAAHRAHASTAIIAQFFTDKAAGFLMQRELDFLGKALATPERPFVAILGGAKVSDKVGVIENLLSKVDTLLIGGAMAYTFYRAKGLPIGRSLVEEDKIELAGALLRKAEEQGVALVLPIDHVIGSEFSASAQVKTVAEDGIEEGWMALDIGPATRDLFASKIASAKTVVWNGPMGCFEMHPFAAGTMAIAEVLARTPCLSIVGGGDSVNAINQSGLADKISHISTGGGASLELLEGKPLPGVVALS